MRRREEPDPDPGRTQPLLPLGPGYVKGVTHGYIRHGTTTLFVALDVAPGRVLAQCRPRHRHQEFLAGQPKSRVQARIGVRIQGAASDAVAQQSHGHIRCKLLLKGLNHVQGGPAQDGHDGGGVAPAQAAVVLAELHVQGAVQTVLAPGGPPPVAADQARQGLRLHGAAGMQWRTERCRRPRGPMRSACTRIRLRRSGQVLGSATHSPRPGPPRTVPVRRSRRPPLRSTVSQRSSAAGVKTPRSASSKAAFTSRCRVGWLRLGRHVVGAGRPQRLHDGGPAGGGVDRDHGPLPVDAVEQAGEGRKLVALGVARLRGHGQPLPHQEGARQVQGAAAVGPVARAARRLAVQGQDQRRQAGQAGAVQEQPGRLHARLRIQPPHPQPVGVVGRYALPQGQPLPEPGPVVVREGGHGGHAVGAPGQGTDRGR